jgi:hypothetical protein
VTPQELLAREGGGVIVPGSGGRHYREQQPVTAAELAGLREIGYVRISAPSWVLEVYRAGFAAGHATTTCGAL